MYQAPARTAHGALYWTTVGWWWAPAKFIGRAALWVFLLPVGVWRSYRHHDRTRELKARRGARL